MATPHAPPSQSWPKKLLAGHPLLLLPFCNIPLMPFCHHNYVNPNDDDSDCDNNNDGSRPDSHLEYVGHQECLTRQLSSQKQPQF